MHPHHSNGLMDQVLVPCFKYADAYIDDIAIFQFHVGGTPVSTQGGPASTEAGWSHCKTSQMQAGTDGVWVPWTSSRRRSYHDGGGQSHNSNRV